MVGRLVGPGAARSGAKGVMGGIKRRAMRPGVRAPQQAVSKPVTIRRPGMK